MKPTKNTLILDLASLAGLTQMKKAIFQIEQEQPQVVLVSTANTEIRDQNMLEQRDWILANSELFIEGAFNLRAYKVKARKLFRQQTALLSEENWWSQCVVLATKLLHLALTECGNNTFWIDAREFKATAQGPGSLDELWNNSQNHIVISQDTLTY